MAQDRDPYGDRDGGFTPYQPDATPDGEPTSDAARTKHRWVAWVAGLGLLLATCGGGVGGIVGIFTDGGEDSDLDDEVLVNDLVAGQCLIGAGFATDEPVSGLESVACSTAHDAEVLEVNVLDTQEVADFDDPANAGALCRPVLSDAEAELLLQPGYGLVVFTETATPAIGDKVACLLVNADGSPLRGPLGDPAAP